ncbi:Type II secretion system protein F [Marinomonas aquimarina]|uniref:Type II secretion system protein F n=1 Tax=Marinomonas aquimarina TaxID=295068 RepID=A0A1A8TGU0_9GAMM|nr:type II secretion system inner membrane protein GspF [Marinomonas aquimarina]SBS32425.1 Type II secretion system protein F [Marinomonas aquimarina]
MAVFEYRALSDAGAKRKGLLEADNERHARHKLREQGLVPLELNSAKASRKAFFQTHLNTRERALLMRQLATLIEAGLPIEETLSGVASQSGKGRVRRMLLAIRGRVLEGFSFAQALSAYPKAFPTLFQASVQAGEESGQLASVLSALADHSEREQANQQTLQSALLYPALLTLVAIAIVSFLLGSVMPDIVAVFVRQKAELPALTEALIGVSRVLSSWGVWLVFALLLSGIALRLAQPMQAFRQRQDLFLLALPGLGRLLGGLAITRYVATLAMLTQSGVPLVFAMDIASKVITNLALKQRLQTAQQQVREGRSLSQALAENRYMPPLMLQLISSGERSGELAQMLDKAARQQSEQSQHRMNNFLTLFEPLMLLVMGAVVLLIVMAILLPIMNMNQLLR